ncbi:DNA helicase [Tanacetum coccineum]
MNESRTRCRFRHIQTGTEHVFNKEMNESRSGRQPYSGRQTNSGGEIRTEADEEQIQADNREMRGRRRADSGKQQTNADSKKQIRTEVDEEQIQAEQTDPNRDRRRADSGRRNQTYECSNMVSMGHMETVYTTSVGPTNEQQVNFTAVANSVVPESVSAVDTIVGSVTSVSKRQRVCEYSSFSTIVANVVGDSGGYNCGSSYQTTNSATLSRRARKWTMYSRFMETPADVGVSTSSKRQHVCAQRFYENESNTMDRPVSADDSPASPVNTSGSGTGFSGPPSGYKHVGSCEHSYEHCSARFWYEERIKDCARSARPKFHRCCMAGRVVIRTYQIYPVYIKLLLRDCHFLENIRAYNQMFSMKSLGAQVDESINIGRGPYVFKIFGQSYHWLGSLCPAEGGPPRFLQLYVYDTHNEVDNRLHHFGGDSSGLHGDIVEGLIELLNNHNALVQVFRTAREKLLESEVPPFKVRLYSVVGAREYELPTGDMLGAIVYEPGPDTEMDYDIIVEQYGYSKEMKLVRVPGISSDGNRKLTMKAYYSYMLHDRVNSFNYLSRTGRLFQQYVVTAFCVVEQNRIDFIHEHQNDIRNEYLSAIYDSIMRGDSNGSDCGGRLILPKSFTGGPWYMYAHYLDALAICRVHGNPHYFITFTCNVKWPEIVEYMQDISGLTTSDRVDIVDRVFEIKIHQFVKYLQDVKPFGKIVEVEFQKRGLPHCHTLIWIDERSRVQNHENIDITPPSVQNTFQKCTATARLSTRMDLFITGGDIQESRPPNRMFSWTIVMSFRTTNNFALHSMHTSMSNTADGQC